MTDNSNHALKIRNLKKTYGSGTTALKGIDLDIKAGEFFGLLGPNGAGKTTIIGIITGLVTKTSGEVNIFGKNIDEFPEETRSFIGVVPQELNFNIFEKVENIIIDQAGFYGIPRKIAKERTDKLLRDLGLHDKKDQKSMALSGGMKRRLMIARALVHNPKFLVLDEPTAGVDVELRRGMWEYLESLTKSGVTILLTTHYLEEAERLCSRIAIINKGEIIENGTTKELISKLQSEKIILDLAEKHNSKILDSLKDFNATVIDEDSIEIELNTEDNLSDAIKILEGKGVKVRTARQTSSKLEELFIKLTS